MNKDDLTKKLENLELPQVELSDHRRRLKSALLNSMDAKSKFKYMWALPHIFSFIRKVKTHFNLSSLISNMEEVKKGLSRTTIAVLAVAAIVLVYSFSRTKNQPVQQAQTALGAQLVMIQGVVEYKEANGEWKRASKDLKLAEGSSVEVLGVGRAVINFDDGSAVRLNKNSRVTLVNLKADSMVILNEKGQIYSRVVKSDTRQFLVKAGDVSYLSLGTAYKTLNDDKVKGVEVYESKVKILGYGDKEILVDQGNKYYLLNKDNKKVEKVITKIATADIKKDEFTMWNKAEDEKEEEFKDEMGVLTFDDKEEEAAVVKTSVPASGITLTGYATKDGVSLNWKVNGVDVSSGFKLVQSTAINPVYPGSDYVYISDKTARSYKWKINDGKVHYFRVCQYLGGKCGKYSNNLWIRTVVNSGTGTTSGGGVTSLYLSAGGEGVKWAVGGYSESGFKVVWSVISSPTYPARPGDQYIYLSDPYASTVRLNAFAGTGAYYVRVCEYLGGKCGKYSNEIKVNLVK
ncbi:MAG: FecR family protein [Patescibacteria group bacterium]